LGGEPQGQQDAEVALLQTQRLVKIELALA
jgi:hypothetical protein